MNITPHFRLSEFDSRDGTPYPAKWIDARLRPLCDLLEEIRALLGNYPLSLISGYRSPAHNKRVGGVPKSQHLQGRAADIVSRKWSPAHVHAVILEVQQAGQLKALRGLGLYAGFVHVDIRPTVKLVQWIDDGVVVQVA